MDRVAKINIEGHNYELIAGGAVEGTCASQASDWTKILVLPEGAALVDGVFLAITFTYGNTAGFAAPETVYSDDGISFFWDDQLTDAVTLPDPRNYTVTLVSGQEYSLIEYPVLYFQDQAFPVCDAKGYKCGGPLWGDGDTITFLFIDHKFFMFLTAVTDQVQDGNTLPVTSGAVADYKTDTVQSGNMLPVTSSAVAAKISGYVKRYNFGTTDSTTKIKININSETSWMLCFVVTLYQGYRATRVMVSGYNYGTSHWYEPEAVLLGDSDGAGTLSVYFGYDANWKLWVGFDGASYTGLSISDVTNGYTQVSMDNLFTISNVSSLGGTTQVTKTAQVWALNANNATRVEGLYTGSGGQQNPQYIGKGYVRFNMMNTTVLGDSTYKNWLLMDCYTGFDVGGATALGISRSQLRAYIMRSDAGTSPNRPTSWASSGEIAILSARSITNATYADNYIVFSNGLIIQWGRRNNSTNNGYSLTFPKAFSNSNYHINAEPNTYNNNVMNCYNRSKTGCTVNRSASASTDWSWFAIGV